MNAVKYSQGVSFLGCIFFLLRGIMSLNIKNITECLYILDTIVEWHKSEWGEDWGNIVRQAINQNTIPTVYVVFKNNKPIATALLIKNDMPEVHDVTPWLAGVYVIPEYRKRKIATSLVKYVLRRIVKMKIPLLWLYTLNSRKLYERLGWEFIAEEEYFGKIVSIMRYTNIKLFIK